MKRFLVVLALGLVAGGLLARTALAAAPVGGSSLKMGSWLRNGAGFTLGAAPTPAPGGNQSGRMTTAPGGGMMNGRSSSGLMGSNTSTGMMGGGSMMDDLQKLLGLSFQQIHDQMVAGKSLVEIAANKDVTKDQLIEALLDGRKVALDQTVKDKRMTQEQATTMLHSVQKNIETMVTAQGMSGMMQGTGGMTPGAVPGGAAPGAGVGGSGGMMQGNGGNSGSCPMHGGQSPQPSGQTSGAGEPQGEWQQA